MEEEAAKPKEITRLAIGKPGGADFTDEDWELITEVRCIPCSRRLDPTKVMTISLRRISKTFQVPRCYRIYH